MQLPKWAGTVLAMDTTTIRNLIAAEVIAAMERTGTSQSKLSREASIPRTTLDRSLRGGRSFPIEELFRMAEVLDTPIEQFLVIPDLKAG